MVIAIKKAFQGFDCDILGVSAGFDTYLDDWNWHLKMEDCRLIGEAVRKGAEEVCVAGRFTVLEGGYDPDLRWSPRDRGPPRQTSHP